MSLQTEFAAAAEVYAQSLRQPNANTTSNGPAAAPDTTWLSQGLDALGTPAVTALPPHLDAANNSDDFNSFFNIK